MRVALFWFCLAGSSADPVGGNDSNDCFPKFEADQFIPEEGVIAPIAAVASIIRSSTVLTLMPAVEVEVLPFAS